MRAALTRTIAITVCLLFAACATKPRRPQLAPSEAVRLATAEARRQHVDLHQLVLSKVSWQPKEAMWMISWDERPDTQGNVHIGGDYSAQVDDATGKVTIIPGR